MNETLDSGFGLVDADDPRVEEARRLLVAATQERRTRRRAEADAMSCECGHRHDEHTVTYSINYTAGACQRCRCLYFLLAKGG